MTYHVAPLKTKVPLLLSGSVENCGTRLRVLLFGEKSGFRIAPAAVILTRKIRLDRTSSADRPPASACRTSSAPPLAARTVPVARARNRDHVCILRVQRLAEVAQRHRRVAERLLRLGRILRQHGGVHIAALRQPAVPLLFASPDRCARPRPVNPTTAKLTRSLAPTIWA